MGRVLVSSVLVLKLTVALTVRVMGPGLSKVQRALRVASVLTASSVRVQLSAVTASTLFCGSPSNSNTASWPKPRGPTLWILVTGSGTVNVVL